MYNRSNASRLDSAAIINFALGFVLRNFETAVYAHENKILFENFCLLCINADLITIQGKFEKFDSV